MKRKLTFTNYYIIPEKKDTQESTQKIQMLMIGLAQHVSFWAVGYHSPQSQLAFHIYYVKYDNTLTCKRISWDSGGGGG